MTPQNPDTPELVPPACRATADRLNRVLDGESEVAALDADPHPACCAACRERVAAARLLLSVLATHEPVSPPPGMADAILAAVQEDRSARVRRRSYAGSVAVCVALAVSVVLVAWLTHTPPGPVAPPGPAPDTAKAPAPLPELAPEPRPADAPQPRPIRIGDELAKAGFALRAAPKTMTEPVAGTPEVLSRLTDALATPLAPVADMEPARSALIDLPDMARTGLEPVTGTAQKAFSRLLRDVGGIGARPKS